MKRKMHEKRGILGKVREITAYLSGLSLQAGSLNLLPMDHRRRDLRTGDDLFPRPFIRSPLWLPLSCILGIGMVFTRDLFEAFITGYNAITINDDFFLTRGVLIGIGVGIYLLWFLYLEEKLCIYEATIQEEKIRKLSIGKKLLDSRLKLLKAQIEPHFLFNTLTSIVSLDDTDPEKAREMQINFMQYLDEAFNKMRPGKTTVGEEEKLIRSYLDIFKIRMEMRLEYDIRVAESIRRISFPSMLIQPVVENAIKHGLEPKVSGGRIDIFAEIQGNKLVWKITDTGIGISEMEGLGIGLGNVIDRLDSLFGPAAELRIEENNPYGTIVTIEVPYA